MSIFSAILEKHDLAPPLLYGISHRRLHPDISLPHYLRLLFGSRADFLQWREKDLPVRKQIKWVEKGISLAHQNRKIFLVNSHTKLALSTGADGVHLTSKQSTAECVDMRSKAGREADFIIGKSVHTVRAAFAAELEGADYLLLGPIFDPISKESDRMPLGLPALREASYMLNTPVFALGGITLQSVETVRATTAVGVAGISWLSREISSGVGHQEDH